MVVRIHSYILEGIDAIPCEIEVDNDRGEFDRDILVGLPDASVRESLERVKSALANSGYCPARGHSLINLAPADVRKEGPMYDLPIAVGMLIASKSVPPGGFEHRGGGGAAERGDRRRAAAGGGCGGDACDGGA